jgi:hypothetical protein
VQATWGIYQRMIAAYRQLDRETGGQLMAKLIDSLGHEVPDALGELVSLGRTLKKRVDDVLAYFDRPGRSKGPAEAINGRLEHLRGSALGFRNLTNYIPRSLLETGGPRLHRGCEQPLWRCVGGLCCAAEQDARPGRGVRLSWLCLSGRTSVRQRASVVAHPGQEGGPCQRGGIARRP